MTKDKQLGKEMLHGRNGQGPFSAWLVRHQPRSCPREGCLLDPQEWGREKVDSQWASSFPAFLSFTKTHALSLMTKIKPWNNIPNAEKGSSITLCYSSLPSTCFIHHFSILHPAIQCCNGGKFTIMCIYIQPSIFNKMFKNVSIVLENLLNIVYILQILTLYYGHFLKMIMML